MHTNIAFFCTDYDKGKIECDYYLLFSDSRCLCSLYEAHLLVGFKAYTEDRLTYIDERQNVRKKTKILQSKQWLTINSTIGNHYPSDYLRWPFTNRKRSNTRCFRAVFLRNQTVFAS
jgi:hypothetical protein